MPETDLTNAAGESAEQHDARLREEDSIRQQRQRKRSVALAWALVALAVLFFIVTIVRLGPMVFNRPL